MKTYISISHGSYSQYLVRRINKTTSAKWLKKRGIVCHIEDEHLEFILPQPVIIPAEEIEQISNSIGGLYRQFVDMCTLTDITLQIQDETCVTLAELQYALAGFVSLWDAFPEKEIQDLGKTEQFMKGMISELRFYGAPGRSFDESKDITRSFSTSAITCILQVDETSDYNEVGTVVKIVLQDMSAIDTFYTAFNIMLKGYLSEASYKDDPRVLALTEECKKFFV